MTPDLWAIPKANNLHKKPRSKERGFAYATDYATQLNSYLFTAILSTIAAFLLWIFFEQ